MQNRFNRVLYHYSHHFKIFYILTNRNTGIGILEYEFLFLCVQRFEQQRKCNLDPCVDFFIFYFDGFPNETVPLTAFAKPERHLLHFLFIYIYIYIYIGIKDLQPLVEHGALGYIGKEEIRRGTPVDRCTIYMKMLLLSAQD